MYSLSDDDIGAINTRFGAPMSGELLESVLSDLYEEEEGDDESTFETDSSEVAKALPLPKVGEVIKGKKVKYVHVIDADASGSFTVGILFDKGVRRKEVLSMLMKLLNAHHITTPKGDYTVGSKDYQVKPTKDGVQVIMAMQITPAIYNNPGKGKKKEMTPLEDFDHHYEKMAIDNP